MGHKPVGVNSSFAIANAANRRGVNKTLQQSDSLRVVAKGAGCHVAIGTLPTAAATNYYVHSGESEVISLGSVKSNRVTGITTGATTTIDFAEGTGSPFEVGDAVSLTVTEQSDYDFTHKIVSSINTSGGSSGFFSTRIIVDHDSSAGNPAALLATSQATLRGSFMVAAFGDGTGTLHYQQVQSSGGAS
jgi:hypothetical protein